MNSTSTRWRHKLSPKLLKLPSTYRTTAWLEVRLPWDDTQSRSPRVEIARFSSSTPGTAKVYASQNENGEIKEITHAQFNMLVASDQTSE